MNKSHLLPLLLDEIKAKSLEGTATYSKILGAGSWALDAREAFKKPVNLMTAVALRVGASKKAGAFYKVFLSHQEDEIFDWNTEDAPSALGLLLMLAQMEKHGYLGGRRDRTNANGSFHAEFKTRVFQAWDDYGRKFGIEKAWLLPLQSVQHFKTSDFNTTLISGLTTAMDLGRKRYLEDQLHSKKSMKTKQNLNPFFLIERLSTLHHLRFSYDDDAIDTIGLIVQQAFQESIEGRTDIPTTFHTVYHFLKNTGLPAVCTGRIVEALQNGILEMLRQDSLDVIQTVLDIPVIAQSQHQDWLRDSWAQAEQRVLSAVLETSEDKPSSKVRL